MIEALYVKCPICGFKDFEVKMDISSPSDFEIHSIIRCSCGVTDDDLTNEQLEQVGFAAENATAMGEYL